MRQRRLLDLCCRAGGASRGYADASFSVVGVDREPQRHHPFRFQQADAIEFAARHYREFDAIHASPNCQGYSIMRFVTGKQYTREIEAFRDLLAGLDRPYVIENVEGAPLFDEPLFGSHAITLCGTMFPPLRVYRHRKFESNVSLIAPTHPRHVIKCPKQGRPGRLDQFLIVTGNCSGADNARDAMGISWMPRDDLSQAIPPAYTEFIGHQLMAAIQPTAAAQPPKK